MTHETRARAAGPRCSTCDRIVAWGGNPARPFRSLTRRLIDLGHWLRGNFRVPGAALSRAAASPQNAPAVE